MPELLEKEGTLVPSENESQIAAEASRLLARTGEEDLRVHLNDGTMLIRKAFETLAAQAQELDMGY